MKFTKEEAFKELKDLLTGNGKMPLRMTERSINGQLDNLMPLLASDDTELTDFIEKVKGTFEVMNKNAEFDASNNYKELEKMFKAKYGEGSQNNPPTGQKDNPQRSDDGIAAVIKRLEELEKKEAERTHDLLIEQKRGELLKKMREKGIDNEDWASTIVSKATIKEDMDVEAEAEDYLKIYNKGRTVPRGVMTPGTPGGSHREKDVFASARKIIQERRRIVEKPINDNENGK